MPNYTVTASAPHTHHIEVALQVAPLGAATVDLVMPVWTPGAYEVHDFAGRVHDFSAVDGSGRPLTWKKAAKNVWQVATGGVKTVIAKYKVFAFDVDVDKSFLDADRMAVNGASVFLYVDGRKDEPCRLALKLPKSWKTVATGLPADRTPGIWTAADYDMLVDCPIMAGNFDVRRFDVRGIPHEMVFTGPGNHDADRLVADTAKVVGAAADVFGEMPYERYVFFMDMTPDGWGGLEHCNSTHMIFPRFRFRPRKDYVMMMGLISHEFFHTWNVKRLRPRPLGPFDYTREVHTPLLWFAEGFTSYFDNLLLRRSGVITAREYLDELAREVRRLRMTPGRDHQSAEESSWDTWIKFYKRHADSENTTISYYNKGALAGWFLDMELRRATGGRKCLDDVMRLLYRRHYKEENTGFDTEDVLRAAEDVAGTTMRPWYETCVMSRGEPDWSAALAVCGLKLDTATPPDDGIDPPAPKGAKSAKAKGASKAKDKPPPPAPRPYLGIRVKSEGGSLSAGTVLADGPAYAAGLSAKDELLALDGWRVGADSLEKRLAEAGAGKTVTLLIARQGVVRELKVRIGERPPVDIAVVPVDKPSAEQKKLRQGWLKTAWSDVDSARSGPDWRPREKLI